MLAFFKKYFNKHNCLTRHLALAAYTAYIFQRFFITGMTLLVDKLHMSSIPSFLLASLWASASTVCASHVIRQLPGLRKI